MPDWPSTPAITEISPLQYIEDNVESRLDKGYIHARRRYHKPLRNCELKYTAISPSDKNILLNFLNNTIRGEATNFTITLPHGHTITNATNASPIVITVSNRHEFLSGDTVVITGIEGNTAANGTFIIQNPTYNTFELVGSTGNGTFSDSQGDALARLQFPNAKIRYSEEQFQGVEKVLGPDVNASGYFTVKCLIEELFPVYSLTPVQPPSSFINWYPSFYNDLTENSIVYDLIEYENTFYALTVNTTTFDFELMNLGSWNVFHTFPSGITGVSKGIVYNSKLYFIASGSIGSDRLFVYSYDIVNGWVTQTTLNTTDQTTMGTFGVNLQNVVEYNNKLYFTTGGDFNIVHSILEYDESGPSVVASQIFSAIASTTTDFRGMEVYNSNIYCIRNKRSSGISTCEIYKYNGSTWSLHQTFNEAEGTSLISYNSKLYLTLYGLNDERDGDFIIWEYNDTTWSISVQLPLVLTDSQWVTPTLYDSKIAYAITDYIYGSSVYFFDGSTWDLSLRANIIDNPNYGYDQTYAIKSFSVTGRLYTCLIDSFEYPITHQPIWCYPTPDDNTIPQSDYPAEVIPASGYWAVSHTHTKNTTILIFNDGIGNLYFGETAGAGSAELWKFDTTLGWVLFHTFPSTVGSIATVINFNSELYVGIDGTSGNLSKIYKYNGSTWSEWFTFPNFIRCVNAAKIFNGELFIGTRTVHVSQEVVIYKENGGTLIESQTFNTFNGRVVEFVEYNSELYVSIHRRIYKYNGSTWDLNFDPNDPVIDPPEEVPVINMNLINSLCVFNGNLYAYLSMSFEQSQPNGYKQIWVYDGVSWGYDSSVTTPLSKYHITSNSLFHLPENSTGMFVHNGEMFLHLGFLTPSGTHIFRYDNGVWALEQYLPDLTLYAFAYFPFNSHMYGSGTFGVLFIYPDLNEGL